jgi:hypothetical protein
MAVHTVENLALELGANWPFILSGREKAKKEIERIREACEPLVLPELAPGKRLS